jgi:HPt (histidine-containing phosphotransfer) domain-containing protein
MMPAGAVLDPAVLERLRQLTPPGEPDVLSTVLRIFVDEMPKRMAQLHEAWARGDAPGVQRIAHSLKGSSGNVGAGALYEVCRTIDERARANDLSGAAPLRDALDREYAAVAYEINRLLQNS